jgi:hypothetical protein
MGKLFDILGLGSGKRNFYVRDFRNAYQLRPDGTPPRQKFEGYVNFIINRSLFGSEDSAEFRNQISSLVRTATLPAADFKTEVKNSYNSKKIVQTGVEYKPVSITVLDTVGNEWLTLLMKYYSYHYMNPRNKQNRDGDRDITDNQSLNSTINISSTFGSPDFDSNAAGLTINQFKYFFERIDYILYHGERAVQYSLINPVLKSFDPGDLDYSSSELMEFKLEFEYENFTMYNETNFVMTNFDLSRFENAAELTGNAFSDDGRPIVLDKQTKLAILGSKENPYGRQDQPIVATLNSVTVPSSGSIATYNDTVDIIATANKGGSQGGWFGNLLKSTAENALTAAINGQNIKNALLGTVVGAAATVIRPGVAATRGSATPPRNTTTGENPQVTPGTGP